jgi:hypothetical protein
MFALRCCPLFNPPKADDFLESVPPFEEEEEEVEAIMCARASVAIIILSCFVLVCSNVFPQSQNQNDESVCKLFDKMTRLPHTQKKS